LDVVYYNTTQGATSKKAKTILKVTETQRHFITRMIFVANPTIISLTFYPVTTTLNNFDVSISPIEKADWKRTNGWRVVGKNYATSSTYNDLIQVQTMKTVDIISRGFYLLRVKYTTPKPKDFVRITFQTDAYKCPYDSPHPDYYHSFQGCTQRVPPISPDS
jgi:hypothetical protein